MLASIEDYKDSYFRQNLMKNKIMPQSPLTPNKSASRKSQTPTRKSPRPSHTIPNPDKLKVQDLQFMCLQNFDLRSKQSARYSRLSIYLQRVCNRIYNFDHVYHHNDTRQQLFESSVKGMVDGVIRSGGNGLVFVYGNTGTGKTYTMGLLDSLDEQSRGIVPDTLRYIFNRLQPSLPAISISFLQIYMDEIYDLLSIAPPSKLSIRQNTQTKQPYIEQEIIINVNSLQQAWQLINIGLERRRVGEQKLNRRSSRGHGVITIYVNGEKEGKICFVDLAGSQRIKETESSGCTLNQALHINSSLSSLETLLTSISDHNIRNYRSSKLTRLLQSYLQQGKIQLFVTSNYGSTQSIEFGRRCKGIKFMERQPFKEKQREDKNNTHKFKSKYLKEQQIIKDQYISRQKNLIKCITSLVSVINHITTQLQQILRSQTIHINFSLSQIMKNFDLQAKINQKINFLEQPEQDLLTSSLRHLPTPLPLSTPDLLSLLTDPDPYLQKLHGSTQGIIKTVGQLAQLAEYRNQYKKQYFTSELKSKLMEAKWVEWEESIPFVLQRIRPGEEAKVKKKLRQIGLSNHNFNGSTNKLQKSKSKQTKHDKNQFKEDISQKYSQKKKSMPFNRDIENNPILNTSNPPIFIQQF